MCVAAEHLTEPIIDQPTVPVMTEFFPTNESELRKIIMKAPSKTCVLDSSPTDLLKDSLESSLPTRVRLVNSSFQSGHFPRALKTAVVTPLLKKPPLDKDNLQNYRPVSGLAHVGKPCEKIAVLRMVDHMHSNSLEEELQSAYKAGHSTETALLKIHNDVTKALDRGKGVLMLYLDLSAAFDTLDRTKLLKTLATRFGVQGMALSWLESYLTDRTQRVRINGTESREVTVNHGVPQGSVLGPVLFSVYTSPLQDILRQHDIDYHKYADDKTLYVEFDPAVPGDLARVKAELEACFLKLRRWMLTNSLQLNSGKTRVSLCSFQESPGEVW